MTTGTAPRPGGGTRQRALLALLAVVVAGAAWWTLPAGSGADWPPAEFAADVPLPEGAPAGPGCHQIRTHPSSFRFTQHAHAIGRPWIVEGTFQPIRGRLDWSGSDEGGAVEIVLDAASVFTDNEMRDLHLRAPDLLHTEAFPTLSFRSTSLRGGRGQLVVEGDLVVMGKSIHYGAGQAPPYGPLVLEMKGALPAGKHRPVELMGTIVAERRRFGWLSDTTETWSPQKLLVRMEPELIFDLHLQLVPCS